MKTLSMILLSASLLSSVAFADVGQIIATYKEGAVEKKVTDSEVMQQFKTILETQMPSTNKKFSELDANLQETLTRAYIHVQLLKNVAESSGIKTSKEFQEELKKIEDQMVQQKLMDNYLKVHVTEKMIDDEYNKLAANLKGKEEIKVSHILVATEAEAKNIKAKLNKGEKFDKLAKTLSKDEGSKAAGGEIGYITGGQLVPEFEEKAFSMKVGEVSTPVYTKFGWHIITVLDKRAAKMPSKEEAKAEISSMLNRKAVEGYFAELSNKAEVKLTLPKAEVKAELKAEEKKEEKK